MFLPIFGLAQSTYVPDDNFEQALIDLGYDDVLDDYVATNNIKGIGHLDISYSDISDLTGIEDFLQLEDLNCEGNLLTTLDLSNNEQIEFLNCNNNLLTTLDLSNNYLQTLSCNSNNLTNIICNSSEHLLTMECENNELTSLDISISGYSVLETLKCSNNEIVNLDLNDNLMYLDCSNNEIVNLNLNSNLEYIDCSNNQLTYLDISNFGYSTINCSYNELTCLDISNSLNITINCSNNLLTSINTHHVNNLSLDCSNNQLTEFILPSGGVGLNKLHCNSNQLTILNVKNGQNSLLTDFNATDNPDLTCIMVDDEDAANAGTGVYATWQKDVTATYAELCDYFTYIPDNSFEQALINLGYDDIIDDFVLTENIDTITNLDVSSSINIHDFTGIQNFAALTHLNCSGNNLSNLDLSSNNIQSLNCSDNQLTNLELENDQFLITLNCSGNQLSSLNLNGFTELQYLHCSNNALTALDLSSNTGLENLTCNNNQLTLLDIKNGNNTILTNLNSTENPYLTCIQVDDEDAANSGMGVYESWQRDATATYSEDCIYYTYIPDDNFENELINLGYDDLLDDYVLTNDIQQITELYIDNLNINDLTGIENFNSLIILNCYDNLLTDLNLSNNTNLEYLNCSDNQLLTLELGNNLILSTLNCSGNQLSSLDFNYLTGLQYLNCSNNSLTAIDLSNNTNIENLTCNNNQLTELDVKNDNNLILTNLNSTENPYLTCIQVDDEEAANMGSGVYENWQTDDIITYSEDCDYTGINKNNEQAFILYPNPCKDVLYIDCNDNIKFISIYNNFGKLIAEYQKTNIFQLADLTSGIYLIKVFTKENCYSAKFIKE